MINLIKSKAPLMVVLRYVLLAVISLLGIVRLRILILLLSWPGTYLERDTLQYYLMAKALVSGVNPYLPVEELARTFIGKTASFPHPSPSTPFTVIFSIPLAWFSYDQIGVVWLVLELVCLLGLACMLSKLIDNRLNWMRIFIIFFCTLAWYLVMVELYLGQLSILLTLLLTSALVVLRQKHNILAGVLIGLSIAIKIITWPVLIYLVLKKDWRAVMASILTTLGLNLVALFAMGIGPFTDYYLKVSRQVTTYYQGIIYNMSLWSIGFRFFTGSTAKPVENYFNAPALIHLPGLAWFVSILLVSTFLILGLFWATKTKELNVAYSILVCLIIAIGPISWHHYYVMIIPGLLILWQSLAKLSFPPWKTLIFVIIFLMFFIGNNQMNNLIIYLNGGLTALEANNYQISFASSLLIYTPLIELIGLSILLWQTGKSGDLDKFNYRQTGIEICAG